VRLIVFFAALGLLPGATVAFLDCAMRLARQPDAGWFAAGTAAGVIVCRPLLRHLPVLETFEHELTHALAALCLLRGVRRFKVTWREGGYVEHRPGSRLGDDLIGLAPYMVPTATFATALVAPLVAAPARSWFFGVTGVTFGYHLVSTVREIVASFTRRGYRPPGGRREVRTDIGQRGLVYSTAFILAGLLLFHGVTAALLADGYGGVPIWGRALWRGTVQAGRAVTSVKRGESAANVQTTSIFLPPEASSLDGG
jgi:hypothetical protein